MKIPADAHCLIVAAHPDDEVLLAGGFMAHHPGCSVAIVSEGTSTERLAADEDSHYGLLERKRRATVKAAQVLNSITVREGEFPDQQLELTRPLQNWIESVIEENRPDVVITHLSTELNRDHRIVAEAVTVACRPFCATGQTVKLVLGASVDVMQLSGLSALAGPLVLPLTEQELQSKLAACRAYEAAGAMRDWPHPRSLTAIEVLARATGFRIGVAAAEAYTLLWGQLA